MAGTIEKIELPLIGTRKTFGEGNQEFSVGHITLEMSIGNCNRNVAQGIWFSHLEFRRELWV